MYDLLVKQYMSRKVKQFSVKKFSEQEISHGSPFKTNGFQKFDNKSFSEVRKKHKLNFKVSHNGLAKEETLFENLNINSQQHSLDTTIDQLSQTIKWKKRIIDLLEDPEKTEKPKKPKPYQNEESFRST